MSWRLGPLNFLIRTIEKRALAKITDPEKARLRFHRMARWLFTPPRSALYLDDDLNGVPIVWAAASQAKTRGVILYFHGGGYVMGAPETHQKMLAQLSSLTGLHACLPRYRLAPENPFPAALEDAIAAYEGLLAKGYPADQITLGGDSAGGGLVLSLLAHICQSELPNPARIFTFSPWTDLTLSGESIKLFEKVEAMLPASRMEATREMYLRDTPPDDPRASPLFAEFPDCPPALILVGSEEILRDDTVRMAETLDAQGADTQVEIWPKAPHVWPIFHGLLPEADEALVQVAEFIGETSP